MKNSKESGFEIGRLLDRGHIKRATQEFRQAVENRVSLSTVRDYSESLADICPDKRAITVYENCGAVTVEDWYRTNIANFEREAKRAYTSLTVLGNNNKVIEGRYSHALWGRLKPKTIRLLHAANILNVWDICHTEAHVLANAVQGSHAIIRELIEIQREFS